MDDPELLVIFLSELSYVEIPCLLDIYPFSFDY
jgi:hypothetical protein